MSAIKLSAFVQRRLPEYQLYKSKKTFYTLFAFFKFLLLFFAKSDYCLKKCLHLHFNFTGNWNQMLKSCIYILFTIFILNSCNELKMITSTTSNREVIAAAKKETSSILKNIPAGTEKLYGFNSADEFSRFQIKETFCFFTMEQGQLKQSTLFFTPVEVDGVFRAIAKLEKIGDNYHVTDFGSAELATEIQPIIKSNPQYSFAGILRIHHLYSDYLVFRNGKKHLFIPLHAARLSLRNLGFNEQRKFYHPEDIINHINAKK